MIALASRKKGGETGVAPLSFKARISPLTVMILHHTKFTATWRADAPRTHTVACALSISKRTLLALASCKISKKYATAVQRVVWTVSIAGKRGRR